MGSEPEAFWRDPAAWSPARAAEVAGRLLDGLTDRWTHTRAVAGRADEAAAVLEEQERDVLVSAAWLHDVGYAHAVAGTGLHQLDGAQYVDDLGAGRRLSGLVAHHSCARFEAAERELSEELARYEREVGPLADALVFADMTTGPTGEPVDVEDRIDEILQRYEAGTPVHRAITNARPELVAAVRRTEDRLERVATPQPM